MTEIRKGAVKGTPYTWGPFLWRSTVPEEIVENLEKRAETVRGVQNYNATAGLAGLMLDEWYYTPEDTRWFQDAINPWMQTYILESSFFLGSNKLTDLPPWTLQRLWINYMHQHEFNPIHGHSGDVSFILFIQAPPEIEKEGEQPWNLANSQPGTTVFLYNYRYTSARTHYSFYPNRGDIYIFPASLSHMVIPFHSPVERISVSGNIKYASPIVPQMKGMIGNMLNMWKKENK